MPRISDTEGKLAIVVAENKLMENTAFVLTTYVQQLLDDRERIWKAARLDEIREGADEYDWDAREWTWKSVEDFLKSLEDK